MIDLSYYTLPMVMGRRKRDRQPSMRLATTDLLAAASHPFYTRLNQLLREHGFDDFAEAQCATFYTHRSAMSAAEDLFPVAVDWLLRLGLTLVGVLPREIGRASCRERVTYTVV